MSHVDSKKRPYSPVEFKGQGPVNRLIDFLHLPQGVKGMVYSSYGQEIKGAKVRIRGREQHWVTTTPNGEFWRLLQPGSYLLQVSLFDSREE